MRARKRRDFERFVRQHARRHGLQLTERQPGTSHKSLSLRHRDGRLLATVTFPGDRSEVSPGTLRSIARALTDQLARHQSGELRQELQRLIDELNGWLRQ